MFTTKKNPTPLYAAPLSWADYLDNRESSAAHFAQLYPEGKLQYRIDHPDGKRVHVQNLLVSPRALDIFNRVIFDFKPDVQFLSADQISSAARWIRADPSNQINAEIFISQKAQWYRALKWAHEHPNWGAPADKMDGIGRLVFYVEREPQILPSDLPKLGWMDKAIVLEEVKDFFEPVLVDFLDFKKYCEQIRKNLEDTPAEQWLFDRAKSRTSQVKSGSYIRPTEPALAQIGG